MLNVVMPRVITLSVAMLNVIMLSVVMLSVVMLSVIMLNVFMLSVVAPLEIFKYRPVFPHLKFFLDGSSNFSGELTKWTTWCPKV
jgi:hypothetical protein